MATAQDAKRASPATHKIAFRSDRPESVNRRANRGRPGQQNRHEEQPDNPQAVCFH